MAIIFLVFWVLFAWMALKAVKNGVLHDRRRLSGWVQFFLALLVFSLSGEAIEQRVDRHVNHWPVAFYIKYFGMVSWFYLYYRLIRGILPRVQHIGIAFGGVIVIGLLSVPFMMGTDDRTLMRHVMVGVRDFCLMIAAVTLFIPATRLLADREHIIGMKTKQQAIVVCYGIYSLIALGNVIKAGLVFIDPDAIPQIERFFTPLLIPGAIAFLCLLLPYRWLTALHIPVRLYHYWRLTTLERYVLKHVGAMDETQPFSLELLQMSVLELTIYRATINILDYGLLLEHDPQQAHLYAVLQEVSQYGDVYAQLIQKLVAVRL
jgi:hypothetical protein